VATDDLITGGTQYHGFLIKGYLRLPRLMGSIKLAGPYTARPHAHTQPGEVINLQARVPEQERACAERITRDLAGAPSPARHQARYRRADGLLRRRP